MTARHPAERGLDRRQFLRSTASGLALAAGASAAEAPADRPNILWITCEDIGPHLGAYGDTYADTPNLDALAERVAQNFRTQTQIHEIVVRFPPGFPPAFGDSARLEQVLDNLVSNAIKYSPAGGTITIAGRALPDEVVVTVTDTGIGIPLEEQPRVFERFYRGMGQRHQRTPGAGLGLYLAKAIVEAHGGRIWVDSVPNEGSAFSFTIPRYPSPDNNN